MFGILISVYEMKGGKMIVNGVSGVLSQPKHKVSNQSTRAMFISSENLSPQANLSSVPSKIALAQMSNVSFGNKYNYGQDNLSSYINYSGPKPPNIEVHKYNISTEIAAAIENEDYLTAIKGKIALAQICKSQAKERDAFILEEGVKRLYKDLPKYLKEQAKTVIGKYNSDMAKYIEEDIKKLKL